MGRCCKLCDEERPHEQFGGRGQRAILCGPCLRLPLEERRKELSLIEIHGFLDQSNISKNNLKRLAQFETDPIPQIAELAMLVKRIALVKPARRQRWRWLWRNHPELVRAAADAQLIDFMFPGDSQMTDDMESLLDNDFLADTEILLDGLRWEWNDLWNYDPES